MMLPTKWIDEIFSRLTVRYGRDFIGRYEGVAADAVKEDWARALGGFINHAEAIAYALDNLPDGKPPNAAEFRSICRRAPQKTDLSLDHKPSAEERDRSRELASQIKQSATERKAASPVDWAKLPKSQFAINAIINLADEEGYPFDEILQELRDAGRVVGGNLVQRWTGERWERA